MPSQTLNNGFLLRKSRVKINTRFIYEYLISNLPIQPSHNGFMNIWTISCNQVHILFLIPPNFWDRVIILLLFTLFNHFLKLILQLTKNSENETKKKNKRTEKNYSKHKIQKNDKIRKNKNCYDINLIIELLLILTKIVAYLSGSDNSLNEYGIHYFLIKIIFNFDFYLFHYLLQLFTLNLL